MLNVSALKSLFHVSNFTISGTIYQDEIMYTFGKEHESLHFLYFSVKNKSIIGEIKK